MFSNERNYEIFDCKNRIESIYTHFSTFEFSLNDLNNECTKRRRIIVWCYLTHHDLLDAAEIMIPSIFSQYLHQISSISLDLCFQNFTVKYCTNLVQNIKNLFYKVFLSNNEKWRCSTNCTFQVIIKMPMIQLRSFMIPMIAVNHIVTSSTSSIDSSVDLPLPRAIYSAVSTQKAKTQW